MRPDEIDTLLNKESGLKGLCGMSDMRDVAKAARHGDEKAQLAINMFTYHAKKYLGSYFAILGRVDGIIFSGGIGEHSAMIREKILHGLNHMGIEIDTLKNDRESTETFEISAPYSKIRVLVTHTDEELEIASETIRILKQN
jgi:acetate kinase